MPSALKFSARAPMQSRTSVMNASEGNHSKRLLLPSGRTIEVVVVGERHPVDSLELSRPSTARSEPAQPASETTASPRALHVCNRCDCRLVGATNWVAASATTWHVSLRCPNCGWTDAGVFSQEALDRFDEELDRGIEVLARDLRALMRANMSEETERFVRALEADAILPEDF